MKTKLLSQSQYAPHLKPWDRDQDLVERVNNESWGTADIPTPPLPRFEKPKKIPLSAGIYNFIKHNVYQLIP